MIVFISLLSQNPANLSLRQSLPLHLLDNSVFHFLRLAFLYPYLFIKIIHVCQKTVLQETKSFLWSLSMCKHLQITNPEELYVRILLYISDLPGFTATKSLKFIL